jgi:hypothetical protein
MSSDGKVRCTRCKLNLAPEQFTAKRDGSFFRGCDHCRIVSKAWTAKRREKARVKTVDLEPSLSRDDILSEIRALMRMVKDFD